jgi:sugar lactone lactonase YvrE
MDELTPFEARLASRLRAESDRRMRPYDARAIAHAAAGAAASRRATSLSLPRPNIGWVRLGLLFGLAAAAVAGAMLVAAALKPDRGELAYLDQGDLYTIGADATDDRLVLDLPTDIAAVEWSPDGAWLVATDAERTIWVVRPDGTQLGRVGRGDAAAWSPDGRSIAWVDVTASGSRPIVHDLATGQDRVLDLPPGTGHANRIGWFPDGSALLVPACSGCVTDTDGRMRTFRVPADGGPATPIEGLDGAEGARLSPDGSTITTDACTFRDYPECRGVEAYDVATGSQHIILPGANVGDVMGWSPDGRWLLAAESDTPDASDGIRLVRMAPDGTGRIVLDPAAGYGTSVARAAISPDGRRVAAVGPVADPLRDGLWVLASDGSSIAFVRGPHDPPGQLTWVGWRPTARDATGPSAIAPAAADPLADCVRVPPNHTDYRHARSLGAAQGCAVLRPWEGLDLDGSTADRVDIWYGSGAPNTGESPFAARLAAGDRSEALAITAGTSVDAATCRAALATTAPLASSTSAQSVSIAEVIASGAHLCVRTLDHALYEVSVAGPWEFYSDLVLSYRRLEP